MNNSEVTTIAQQLGKTERILNRELRALRQSESINETRTTTRKRAKEALEESPNHRAVIEHIEQIQLRLQLIRNIRLNWHNFEEESRGRNIPMRINQLQGLRELVLFLENGKTTQSNTDDDPLSGYYIQPTGAGKTGLFSIEVRLMDVPTLILVPFDNLLEQTVEDIIKIGGIGKSDIGILGGGKKETGRKYTVATYAGHAAQMRRKGDYMRYIQTQCKVVVCDEVHTALGPHTQKSLRAVDGWAESAPTRSEQADMDAEEAVLERLHGDMPTKSLKIGFTATAQLAQKHVDEYFPHLIGRVHHADMVQAGILVPYKIIHTDGSVHVGEIDNVISEKQEVEILEREGVYPKLLGEYADALATYRKAKRKTRYPLRGMAFCTNHEECEKLVEQAQDFGLRCEIITGREASGSQAGNIIRAAKERLRKGKIDLMVSVEKLCAGFNFPEVNAIIWARVTSMAKTIQGIGRGSRSHREGNWVKDACYAFETNWTLKNNAKRGKKPLRIADALAQNGENPEIICSMADGSKLDYARAPDRDHIRSLIQKDYSAESWVALGSEKHKLKYEGLGIVALGRLFGIIDDPSRHRKAFLELGRAIWDDHPALEIVEEVELRDRIKNQIQADYTAQTWAEIHYLDRKKMKYEGQGLGAIARLFGLEGNPVHSKQLFLALGVKIFGIHPMLELDQGKKIDRILRMLRKDFKPDTWVTLNRKQCQTIHYDGLPLSAIARLLGIDENPATNKENLLALGRKIWGDLPIFDLDQQEQETAVSIRAAIQEDLSAEEWLVMKRTQREQLQYEGLSIRRIATLLGVPCNAALDFNSYIQLGRIIWGDQPIFDIANEENETDMFIAYIKFKYAPETWANSSQEERGQLKFGELGLKYLATQLGINSDPTQSDKGRTALGHAIWGEDFESLDQEKRSEIQQEMRERYTPQQWADMNAVERWSIEWNGLKIRSIATIFGIESKPRYAKPQHFALGKIIWEKNWKE